MSGHVCTHFVSQLYCAFSSTAGELCFCEAGNDTGFEDMKLGYPADVKAGRCTQ